MAGFSTHSPRKGMETKVNVHVVASAKFSTHSPRKGMETGRGLLRGTQAAGVFNPLTPQGDGNGNRDHSDAANVRSQLAYNEGDRV